MHFNKNNKICLCILPIFFVCFPTLIASLEFLTLCCHINQSPFLNSWPLTLRIGSSLLKLFCLLDGSLSSPSHSFLEKRGLLDPQVIFPSDAQGNFDLNTASETWQVSLICASLFVPTVICYLGLLEVQFPGCAVLSLGAWEHPLTPIPPLVWFIFSWLHIWLPKILFKFFR